MKLDQTPIQGAYLISFESHVDSRGGFRRLWCARAFAEAGLACSLAQNSLSSNVRRGTLRGLHYQRPPAIEEKVVSCVRGRLFDVIADLRSGSQTCGRWYGVELVGGQARALYVPNGVAHGFVTLENDTDILYQISDFYDPHLSAGVRWDDPHLAIDWPIEPVAISDRDRHLPPFAALEIA